MRRELIEALSYPRLLVQRIIDSKDCPHGSFFDVTSERCHQCDLSSECHWAACLDEFADFADKPTYTINASLRYGVKLVESLYSELRHDETRCTCESCSWVRYAQQLIEAFEQDLAPNRYRPTH